MVYYFTSNAVSPSAFVYVGKDKFESMKTALYERYKRQSAGTLGTTNTFLLIDEDLIKYGWEEDVWYEA